MASLFYNNYYEELGKAFYNETTPTGTVKIALMTTAYTPNADTHAYYSDLTGELSGGGYTAGGQAVNNLTITQNNTLNRADIDFDPETFSALTAANVNAVVLYKDTGVTTTSPLIAYFEFAEGAQTVNDGSITVTPPVAGVHTIG